MEYAKDEIFNIKYNAKLDKLEMKSNTRLNRMWRRIKHHKLMTTVMLAFVIFSMINVAMIWSFMNILQNF